MPYFQVMVEITGDMTYLIKAQTQNEAEAVATEMASNGVNLTELNITNHSVIDAWDESIEHETFIPE